MSRKQDFIDPDLKTPAHDAIMIWLHENAAAVVDQVFGVSGMVDAARAAVLAALASDEMQPVAHKATEVMAPRMIDVDCVWEHPVSHNGGQRYIDLLITATAHLPGAEVNDEQRRIPRPGAKFGECDTVVCRVPWLGFRSSRFALACEVKPVIRSVGELIRQLRQYESWNRPGGRGHSRVAVVSPDDRFRSIIESQGFVFIKAPTPDIGPQRSLI